MALASPPLCLRKQFPISTVCYCKRSLGHSLSPATTERLLGTETVKIALVGRSTRMCMFTDGDDWSK